MINLLYWIEITLVILVNGSNIDAATTTPENPGQGVVETSTDTGGAKICPPFCGEKKEKEEEEDQ